MRIGPPLNATLPFLPARSPAGHDNSTMDIFRQGRGDNAELVLKPAIPGRRNIVIGLAVVLVALFLCSLAVRITRMEAGHVGVLHREQPADA